MISSDTIPTGVHVTPEPDLPRKPRVMVTHPGRQHVHQLCYALQQQEYLHQFITSVWYKPDSFWQRILTQLPVGFGKKIHTILQKRFFAPLHSSHIHTFPYAEVARQLTGFSYHYADSIHDRYVARFGNLTAADIVIGYENASLQTFRKAKQHGKLTILDLAQVHHRFIAGLRDTYPAFRQTLEPENHFREVNHRKEEQYRYTDYVFVLSSLAHQTLTEAGFPADRIYTLNLGFDPSEFLPKERYNSHGPLRLLFAGTLTKRKGFHLLLEAVKQLQRPDIQVTLVGPVADGADVLAAYRGCYTHVPFAPHPALVHHYQQADVFVFPSYLDSWAMVVPEAMACGTPVIVSENTGSKDVVQQGGGYVVPVDNIEALKEKIMFFYHNRQQIELLGQQARRVAEKYTWQSYYQQLTTAINDIWQRHQP